MRAVWALGWRAVVFLPAACALLVLLIAAYVGVIALPFAAAFFIWGGDLLFAVGCLLLWGVSFLFLRYARRRERSDSAQQGVLI